ncbi:integrase core domain-containing protein, partial [Acinetobacter baumannii]|uniref:integrase core domain-containing protein n=1 Tax=Acinetobacter baumannii TaxID=470 RepID=UPI001D17383B
VPAYGPQNDVTLKMPAFEWVHVQLHQQKGMISLSPPTICNSADFCISALNEAIEKYGRPEIFNTDQGSQFTSDAFIDVLKSNGIQISMDGKGRWVDNVMVERLWRSVKYEEVYLKAYSNVLDAKKQLNAYFEFYNLKRPHSSLDKMTPDEFYYDQLPQQNKVA